MFIAIASRDSVSHLADLRQEGCLKARFPRPAAWPADGVEAVLLNSAGGIAGGDRLDVRFEVRKASRGSLATQAAERFYRVLPGHAASVLRNEVSVAEGGYAEWLPQESIVFNNTALDRRLDVTLAETARFLGVEMLVFGRHAMGERVNQARLSDTITLKRSGRLIWQDSLRFEGDVQDALDRTAIGGGARAMATLVYASPDAGTFLATARAALASFEAGVSTLDSVLVARVLAQDGATLRAAVASVLQSLRGQRRLPRVWGC